MSGTFPGHFPQISRKFLGNVLAISWTFPGNLTGVLRPPHPSPLVGTDFLTVGVSSVPGNFLEFPRNFPGHIPDISGYTLVDE